jgi:hypothetical protein
MAIFQNRVKSGSLFTIQALIRFVFIQKNDDGWHGRDRRFVAPV